MSATFEGRILDEGLGRRLARESDKGGMLVLRWLGCWVDFIALAAIIVAPLALAYALNNDQLGQVMLLVSILAALAYFPVTEALWGRSAGKFVTGLMVVDDAGNVPGWGKAFVRTLLRLVEVNPFLIGGIPAGIVLLLTEHKQRLGDLLAGTYVVSASKLREGRPTANAATVF